MNLKEAYNVFGISPGSTQEEIKKQYKLLAKVWHPDINKAPDAEDKFKKINEAYQCLQNGKGDDREPTIRRSSYYNPFEQSNYMEAKNIDLDITISFKESVLGCKKDIKFSRHTKCNSCNGQGEVNINNGCTSCNGRGQVVNKNGNAIFIQTCMQCHGNVTTEPCKVCNSDGFMDAETSVNVNVPGGVQDGNILRLGNMGNYIGQFIAFERYTDVHLTIKVISEPGLSLSGINVMSTLDLTLLEALQGCTKRVKTINGNKEIEIKPMSRHNDQIIIPKMGVNNIGDQVVSLNVSYPKDINKIISVLTEKGLN